MSSKLLKVGVIQSSLENKADKAEVQLGLSKKIAKLAEQGAQLVVLQELHDHLYFCVSEKTENFDLAETIPGPSTDFYGQIAKEHQLVLVLSIFEKRAAGLYHNTAVVLEKDGSIAGKYRKMHIPDDPGFYEKFYFTPGDLGFEPIVTSVGTLGVLVCWDQWYPEAARLMALKGAELLIYPTAIGWSEGDDEAEKSRQLDAWKTIQRSHAIANGIPLVAVNRTGKEGEASAQDGPIEFWGNSFICGPQGEELLAFGVNEETNILALDLNRSEQVRRWWPFFRDRRIEEYDGLLQRYVD